MDDLLELIRNRSRNYDPKTEGVSPKQDTSSTRHGVIFKRKYTQKNFKTMLTSIKSIYDKEVYNEVNKIKDEYDIKFVYPMDLNIDVGDMNSNDVYELIIDVVDLPIKSDQKIKSIMTNALPKFRKLGMPFEIEERDGKLFFHSKVVFQVV